MRNAAMNSGYYVYERPTQKPKLQSKKEALSTSTQKKSYITQPGQKPFERGELIPNKGYITSEQFFSDVNKNKKPIPYNKKDDTFDGGSKKELTVTAPKLKPKTQASTPTKQEVKPTQKTSPKPKEEVKTTSKQTYLKPKGEVNQKVKLFQKMLLDEGFDLGKTADDGIWGAKTQAAFEKLQANKANYAIAMEKFKQLDEELKPKTIPQPMYAPSRLAPATPTTFPRFKKGGMIKKKSKKCSCGCAMKISKNAKGGLIESCACGCKLKNK
jgi:hypothetical protein